MFFKSLHEIEKEQIERVLKHTKGDKRSACKILGISMATIYRKIAQYDIRLLEGKCTGHENTSIHLTQN